MKRLLLCILGVAGMAMTSLAQQDYLAVWHKDGSKVLFRLTEKPKVTYGDSLVTIQTSTTVEYAFQAIQKMTFESEEVVGIKEMETKRKQPFASDGRTVSFLPAESDLRVRVVSMSGLVVKDFVVRKGEQQSFSFQTLPLGVYVMSVNGVTYKIKTR